MVFPCLAAAFFVAWLAASWSKKVEKVGKIVVLVGFQKGRLAVFGRFFSPSPSFTAMVFSHPGGVF